MRKDLCRYGPNTEYGRWNHFFFTYIIIIIIIIFYTYYYIFYLIRKISSFFFYSLKKYGIQANSQKMFPMRASMVYFVEFYSLLVKTTSIFYVIT